MANISANFSTPSCNGFDTIAFMNIFTSKKRWIAAVLCLLTVLAGSSALAKTYRVGDEADEIATIQTALTTLKLYSGKITGHFGDLTKTAVQDFQKRYALKADGVVGEDTLKTLYEAAGIDAGASVAPAAASDSALLRYGSQNEAVRQLQNDLKSLGYYTGSTSGHFGSLTEAAVMNFQKKNGLTADGVVGAKTLAKLATLKSGNTSSGSSTLTRICG